MAQHTKNHHPHFTNAERLTRADDLMSDVLDCFLWPADSFSSSVPAKRTIKFTSGYRRPRSLNINDFKQIIHSVQSGQLRNLTEATTLVRQLPAVISYIANAEPPRLGKHIGLYLQLFLPKCGVRFCETDRYDQRRGNPQNSDHNHHQTPLNPSSSSKPKSRKSKIRPNELRDLLTSAHLPPTSPSSASSSSASTKINSTRSSEAYLSTNNIVHLAVFAAKDYSPNDIVVGCEGSFADLTEQEDLKLRSNAHLPIYSNLSSHPHRTDFSHIVNSRGKFQVFCGPARFVNHDCNNNVELLREGFTIKFKVIKPIKAGQEILTSYGMNYFGEKNCECMCATCERNGMGFYSSSTQETVHPGDPKTQPVEEADSIRIKKESDESNPSLGTDTTDLSSLADGSDGTLSRASNTPVLEHSPTRSFSHTPSQVRRQLALPSSHYLSALSDKKPDLQSHSRSPSTRRKKRALSDRNQKNLTSTHFVSPVKFLPTHALTLPVLSNLPKSQESNQNKIVIDFEPSISEQSDHLVNSKSKSQTIESLPIKRKTYWITTKQKQLGLVPWQSEPPTTTTTPPPPSLISSQQPYSPQTPSLLNPTKRKVMSEPGVKKKIKSNEEKEEQPVERGKRSEKGPMRSYWVSTKEKQLGIVPWEINTPSSSLPLNPTPPTTTRSTRSSRKASQDTPDITRFPIAPKGSKLSYKVFQKGTQEAELLNTAIGRELLGFRPKVHKKNQQQKQHQDDLNQKDAQQEVKNEQTAGADSSNGPSQVIQQVVDETMMIETLEEISSFLMNHPEPTLITTTPPPTTNPTSDITIENNPTRDYQIDMKNGCAVDHQADDQKEGSSVQGTSIHQPNLPQKSKEEDEEGAQLDSKDNEGSNADEKRESISLNKRDSEGVVYTCAEDLSSRLATTRPTEITFVTKTHQNNNNNHVNLTDPLPVASETPLFDASSSTSISTPSHLITSNLTNTAAGNSSINGSSSSSATSSNNRWISIG